MRLMKLEFHLSWTNYVTALISCTDWHLTVSFYFYILLSLTYVLILWLYLSSSSILIYIYISSSSTTFGGTLFTAFVDCRKSVISKRLLLSFRCNCHSRWWLVRCLVRFFFLFFCHNFVYCRSVSLEMTIIVASIRVTVMDDFEWWPDQPSFKSCLKVSFVCLVCLPTPSTVLS